MKVSWKKYTAQGNREKISEAKRISVKKKKLRDVRMWSSYGL